MKDVIAITFDQPSGGPLLTAQERRQIDAGLYAGPGGQAFSGYRGGAVGIVGTSVTIQPLTFVVQGTGTGTAPLAAQGTYRGAFPSGSAELSKTLAAPHASLTRWDALDIRVYDHEADSSGLRGADIIYTPGTANSTPSVGLPAALPNSVRMGHFVVPASGAATFVPDANTQYAMAGGARLTASGLVVWDGTADRTVWESQPAHWFGRPLVTSYSDAAWTGIPHVAPDSSDRITYTSAGQFTLAEIGFYDVSLGLNWIGNTTGTRGVKVIQPGGEEAWIELPAETGYLSSHISVPIRTTAINQTLTLQGFQSSGGSLGLDNRGVEGSLFTRIIKRR
jgi:hypothetical protein